MADLEVKLVSSPKSNELTASVKNFRLNPLAAEFFPASQSVSGEVKNTFSLTKEEQKNSSQSSVDSNILNCTVNTLADICDYVKNGYCVALHVDDNIQFIYHNCQTEVEFNESDI